MKAPKQRCSNCPARNNRVARYTNAEHIAVSECAKILRKLIMRERAEEQATLQQALFDKMVERKRLAESPRAAA